MKRIQNIFVTMLMIGLMNPSAIANEPSTADGVLGGFGDDIVDEVLFDNLNNLSDSGCDLVELGVDYVNFFDGGWSVVGSLVDTTVLFRNEAWRELIWALEDERERFRQQHSPLLKKICLLHASQAELGFKENSAELKRVEEEIVELERQVDELEAKMDYFFWQRMKLLGNKVFFHQIIPSNEDTSDAFVVLEGSDGVGVRDIPTDKIFYWLHENLIDVNWNQFWTNVKDIGSRTWVDIDVALQGVSEGCFAGLNVVDDMWQHFVWGVTLGNVETEEGITDFRDFVEYHDAKVKEHKEETGEDYYGQYCRPAEAVAIVRSELLSAEEQHQQFQEYLQSNAELYQSLISKLELRIGQLDQKRTDGSLSDDEKDELEQALRDKHQAVAALEFSELALSRVGAATSDGLDALSEKISELVEAILDLQRTEDDEVGLRSSISERIQKSKERSLQNICSRIEAMYRQTGRSLANLPIVGSVNGVTYCASRPGFEGINAWDTFLDIGSALVDVARGATVGLIEGLADWVAALFEERVRVETERTRQNQPESDDIGILFEQEAFRELTALKHARYHSLRKRYELMYGVETGLTAAVENDLRGIANDIFGPEIPAVYNPKSTSDDMRKTHYGMLRKVYQDFYTFADAQDGTCSAVEEPGE